MVHPKGFTKSKDEYSLYELRSTMDQLAATNSRKEKKRLCRDLPPSAVSILSPSDYDDIGLGSLTLTNVLNDSDELYSLDDDAPTVTEALASHDGDGDYSCEDLCESLDALDAVSGNEQKSLLREVFATTSVPSVVSYAILNDEGLGVSDKTLASALDARDALPFYDEMYALAVDAQTDSLRTSPIVGESFKPMLAKSKDVDNSFKSQLKIDGYRLLIHTTSDGTKAFTRRQNDVTHSLPELADTTLPEGYIFDAEVISDDGEYKTTSKRVGADDYDESVEMEFKLFDVVVADGESIADEPFHKRFERLTDVESEYCEVLTLYDDIDEAKRVALSEGYEGIIAKDMSAPYSFDKRSSAWRKDKHEAETIDAVVTDFTEGDGRLTGSLGTLTLESSDGVSLGRVGTGFSDAERDEIWQNRDEWRGAIVEVTAEDYEEGGGLRFPRFERRRDVGGEADSIDRVMSLLDSA